MHACSLLSHERTKETDGLRYESSCATQPHTGTWADRTPRLMSDGKAHCSTRTYNTDKRCSKQSDVNGSSMAKHEQHGKAAAKASGSGCIMRVMVWVDDKMGKRW